MTTNSSSLLSFGPADNVASLREGPPTVWVHSAESELGCSCLKRMRFPFLIQKNCVFSRHSRAPLHYRFSISFRFGIWFQS